MEQSQDTADEALIVEALVSCASAEGFLRGMIVRLDFSADDLLSRHLAEFEATLDVIAARKLTHPGVEHLRASGDLLRSACAAFDPWRFSSDPEYAHLPLFQRESLRLLDAARAEREAATQLIRSVS